MAEQQPGKPGGSSAGPHSATAATFVVNDSTLRGLRTTFQGLTKDVQNFGTALQGLSKGAKTLESVQARLASLGLTGSGSQIGGGERATGAVQHATHTVAGEGRAPNAGDSHFTRVETPGAASAGGQGRGGGAQSAGGMAWRTGAVVGGSALVGAGNFYRRSMGGISDLDLMFNQQAQMQGGGYSRAKFSGVKNFLTGNGGANYGIGGYQSAQDLATGVSNIQGVLGGGVGNGRTNDALRAAGQLAALNPSGGISASSSAVAGLYNPVTANRLRSFGIPQGARGKNMSPGAIYSQIQRLVFRGRKPTADMINEGLAPGAPLYNTLVMGLGIEPGSDTFENFRMYAIAQINLGGGADSGARVDRALSDAQAGKMTKDVRALGLKDSIRSRQNEKAAAGVRRDVEAGAEGKDAIQFGFTKLASVTDDLTQSFRALNKLTLGGSGSTLGASTFIGGPIGGMLNSVGGIAGAGFAGGALGHIYKWARGHPGGNLKSRVAGGLAAGAGGAIGASGISGTPVFVMNWPSGFGGGGGGFDPTSILGNGGKKAAEHEAEQVAKKGFLRRIGSSALSKMPWAARAATAVSEAASSLSWGLGGVSGMASMAARAIPVVGLATAAVGIWSHDINALTHAGAFGAPDDATIARRNAYASDSRLTNAVHQLTINGYMKVPDARKEWDGRVRALVAKAGRTRNPDDVTQALSAVHNIMARYRDDARAANGRSGLRADGSTFSSPYSALGTHQTASYGISQPGGSTSGGGAGRTGTTTPSSAGGSPSVVSIAEQYVGMPYKWGGSTPSTSFDCSGLLQWAYGQVGIKLPRTSQQQQSVGVDVPLDKLAPGDLLFYHSPATHEAMYIGNGQMIEAPQTGELIRNTRLRTPTNARRVLTGGAPGSAGAGTSTGSATGATATGKASTGTASPVGSPVSGFGDEMSGLANILASPSLLGSGGSGGMTARALTSRGATSASAAGSAGSGGKASGQSAGSSGAPNGPAPGGTVGGWVQQALGIMHLDFKKYGSSIATIIQHESSGDPHAINNWDTNAKAGHPSKGLMQTIDSTFAAHALPGHGDIWNPVDNIIAATRYALARYGSMDNVPGIKSLMHGGAYKGYSSGAWDVMEGPAQLHHGEMIVPASTARKVRSMIARGQMTNPAAPVPMSRPAGGNVTMTVHAPISLVGSATPKDAKDFLRMVKTEAEKEFSLNMVGSG